MNERHKLGSEEGVPNVALWVAPEKGRAAARDQVQSFVGRGANDRFIGNPPLHQDADSV